MKLAGLLLLAVGVCAGIVFSVLPVSFTVLGTPVSCGLPVTTSTKAVSPDLSDDDAAIEQECITRSFDRMIDALVFAGAGAVIGGGLAIAGARAEERG